MNDEVPI